jgi:hypothetical protein
MANAFDRETTGTEIKIFCFYGHRMNFTISLLRFLIGGQNTIRRNDTRKKVYFQETHLARHKKSIAFYLPIYLFIYMCVFIGLYLFTEYLKNEKPEGSGTRRS